MIRINSPATEVSKSDVAGHSPFRLGEWRIDPQAHTLMHVESESRLPPKVMAVLVHLAHNHHRLVTREELIEEIWHGNAYVGAKALTNAIWQIRHAFGDSHDIVKTVPKTGYQLLTAPEFEEPTAVVNTTLVRKRLFPWLVAITACLVLFSFISGYQWLTGGDQPEPEPELLVDMPGRELYPVPSPDGRFIAFQAISLQGQRDIYLKDLVNPEQEVQQITDSQSYDVHPAWSGDGKHLAYINHDSASGDCDVIVQEIESGEETIVNRCLRSEYDFTTLSWSPNGRWLVHRFAYPGEEPGLYLWPVDQQGTIDSDQTPKRISCSNCLFVDQEVSWSPDSRKLAVTRRQNRLSADIYLYDLINGGFERLTTNEHSIKGHTWYSDNRTLLYVANRGPRDRQLRAIDTLTHESRRLGIDNAGFPVFLPGYEGIVFYRRVVDTHISSIRLHQEDGLTRLPSPIIQTANAERSPAVHRPSNRIVFISNVSGFEEIWVAGFDGSGAEQLTHLKGTVEDPAWSPDGTRIVFISGDSDDDTDHIQLLDVATGEFRTLNIELSDFGPPSWAADGRSLIVPVRQNGVFDLWRIHTDDSQNERLTLDGGKFGREDPSGQHVYYTKSNIPGLFRLDRDGNSELVSGAGDEGSGWANWDWISKDELVFSEVHGDQIVLSQFKIGEDDPTVIYTLPLRSIHRQGRLSYSPLMDSVIFTHRELPQIDIWIARNPL